MTNCHLVLTGLLWLCGRHQITAMGNLCDAWLERHTALAFSSNLLDTWDFPGYCHCCFDNLSHSILQRLGELDSTSCMVNKKQETRDQKVETRDQNQKQETNQVSATPGLLPILGTRDVNPLTLKPRLSLSSSREPALENRLRKAPLYQFYLEPLDRRLGEAM